MALRAAAAATWPVLRLALLLAGLVVAAACGRKGPPLPPLVEVPAPVDDLALRRQADVVYVSFTVPAQNVDGTAPARMDRVEVFAVTATERPAIEDLLRPQARIASIAVAPVDPDDRARGEPLPDAAVQGGRVTVRDVLAGATATAAGESVRPQRYYLAIGTNNRGRSAPAGRIVSVPADPAPPAPSAPTATHTAEEIRLTWPAAGEALSYYVYRDAADASSGAARPDESDEAPVPLNGSPLQVGAYSEPVFPFGEQRCYRVRAVRATAANAAGVESEPSPRTCITPEDLFPPAAPTELEAVAGPDGIALRWAANGEPDLAGYLILRGAPGDVTLLPLTDEPVADTQYLDRQVTPGTRYEYAVVAVDSRQPPNRSPESARDAATAR